MSHAAPAREVSSDRLQDVWSALAEVPDPEVPALNVVELGIVRDVTEEDGAIVVALTPTYTGCPATDAITLMVKAKLHEKGFAPHRIDMQLTPPWTTDLITDDAREKLRRYGIAPPNGRAAPGETGEPAACPRCGSRETELVSAFGSTACKALYRCTSCREPFEYFKCH